MIQNRVSGITKNFNKLERITSVSKEFQWLPVEQRNKFNVTALTDKFLNKMTLKYLTEILEPYK